MKNIFKHSKVYFTLTQKQSMVFTIFGQKGNHASFNLHSEIFVCAYRTGCKQQDILVFQLAEKLLDLLRNLIELRFLIFEAYKVHITGLGGFYG